MPKRIVICADGTWNTPDQKDGDEVHPSNVTKTALCVAPCDKNGMPQIVYYDKGVGTEWYDRIRGGISGVGISKNIKQAYRFLVDTYEEGDEVFLFGFSRGAYTVRSTVGLIRNCGLLNKENSSQIDSAFDLYRRRDNASHPAAIEAVLFRKTYSREIPIKFIGVWDTVGALGIPVKNLDIINRMLNIEFHDVQLSRIVENAYQALAIDEVREPFQPCIWEQQSQTMGQQQMEQVWFAGVHSNIGGGYADSGLSDIAFLWMNDKAEACGLEFDCSALETQNIVISPRWDGVLRDSKTFLYKLFSDYIRPIGKAKNGNESVHPYAKKRFTYGNGSHQYRPKNLREYMKSN
jgi:uncharacterized protein (DUF2235 family)